MPELVMKAKSAIYHSPLSISSPATRAQPRRSAPLNAPRATRATGLGEAAVLFCLFLVLFLLFWIGSGKKNRQKKKGVPGFPKNLH
jgi:hypothetical protein